MAQSVGHLGRNYKPTRGGMAQSVEHIVHIDGVVGSSPTVTTIAQPLKIKGCDFLSPGTTADGFIFFRVHLGDVDGSCHHSVHTVVWLSCRKIGVARLVEMKLPL